MSKRAGILATVCLICAIAISGCTAVVAAPASQPQATIEAPRGGVDPASPLATSVLLQFCSSADCELQLIDTETGAAPAGFEPLALGSYSTFSPSGDLTRLAVITYHNNTYLRDGRLHFVDLATWEVKTTSLAFDGAYNTPLFTPDNARLIVLTQNEVWPASDVVHLVDIANEKVLAEHPLDFYPMAYQLTAGGAAIMSYGTKGDTSTQTQSNTYVALLDASSLEVIWQERVDGLLNGLVMKEGSSDPHDGVWWQPSTVFAPDSSTLYIVHADQAQLTTVDFSAQRITTSAITKPLSWIERLLALSASTAHAKMANGVNKQSMLSADGAHLYVVGTRSSIENEIEFVQTGLGLQVIDLTTGQEIAHIDSEAQSLSVEPSSGRLFLHGWTSDAGLPYTTEWTEVLDADSFELLRLLEHRAVAVAYRLDGKPVLLSTTTLENGQTELAALDPQTFEVISSSAERYRGYVGWVVLR